MTDKMSENDEGRQETNNLISEGMAVLNSTPAPK